MQWGRCRSTGSSRQDLGDWRNQDLGDFDGFPVGGTGDEGVDGMRGGRMVRGWGVGRYCCLNQDLQDSNGFSGWGFTRDETMKRMESRKG